MLKKLWLAALLLSPDAARGAGDRRQFGSPRFPGAVGWAAHTAGGRGGKILRVTTLATDGPGSLKAAIDQGPAHRRVRGRRGDRSGPRHADDRRAVPDHRRPDRTLARHHHHPRRHRCEDARRRSSRHIRVMTGVDGQAKRSGWEADAFSTVAAHNVVVEHCSFLWGVDENMSASGPRFTGKTLAEWRAGTSRNIVFREQPRRRGPRRRQPPQGRALPRAR